jgi:hypothetical protein
MDNKIINFKKFKKLRILLLMTFVSLMLSSCLTCETKEYIFTLTGEHSGKLTIRYFNIFSNSLDSAGEIISDYDELANMWLDGEKIERDFPKAKKFKKRLYEANGVLNGEVSMEFDNLEDVRLYRFNNSGPVMFSTTAFNDDGEIFRTTNGIFGNDNTPVIFWNTDEKSLRITTRIASPDSTTVSLLETWKSQAN